MACNSEYEPDTQPDRSLIGPAVSFLIFNSKYLASDVAWASALFVRCRCELASRLKPTLRGHSSRGSILDLALFLCGLIEAAIDRKMPVVDLKR